MGSQDQHFLHEFKVIPQNWTLLAIGRRFFLMRSKLLLLTCRRLCTGAFLTPENDAFDVLMRFFTLDPTTQKLQLAFAGLVTSYNATIIELDATGPQL
jgi:hypothetical protein